MPFMSLDESVTGTTAGAGAVELTLVMSPRTQYRITCKGAPIWFSVVAAGGTAASIGGATSHFLITGDSVLVAAIGAEGSAGLRNKISVIRDTGTDASAIVSHVVQVQSF